MKKLSQDTKLDPVLNISRIPIDSTSSYELTQETKWVDDLFNELEENTDREDSDYNKGSLNLSITVKRKSEKSFGDHVLVSGTIDTDYYYPCVRCLKLTKQEIHEEFRCAFLHKSFEKAPEYEEVDDIFTENEEFDLYFHEKGQIDLNEAVHEQIFIHADS